MDRIIETLFRDSVLAMALLGCASPARAQYAIAVPQTAAEARDEHDAITGGGAWRFKSVPCVDGVISGVTPRLGREGQTRFTAQDYQTSGVVTRVRLLRPTAFVAGVTLTSAGVTHYQGTEDNDVMAAEHPGDRVQVCLMSFPTPTYDATRRQYICDPDRDSRGWTFRIYDYRQHAAYYGSDTQHPCGGA